MILCNVGPRNVPAVAENFRDMLDQYSFLYGGKNYKVNGSIGVALIDCDTHSPGEVLANADIACHLAKRSGRNQVHLYRPESDAKLAKRLNGVSRVHEPQKHWPNYYACQYITNNQGLAQLFNDK